MIFKQVIVEDKPDIEFLEKLYIESFPRNERRPVLEMLNLIENESAFVACVLIKDGVRVGIFTYWDFEDFIYAEHFAIDPERRGDGCGKLALLTFTKGLKKPIILEVEPPEDEFSIRRINFYERTGFKSWDIPYLQPPYEKEFEPFPLKLMTLGEIDLNQESVYENVRKTIYEKAYRYHPSED